MKKRKANQPEPKGRKKSSKKLSQIFTSLLKPKGRKKTLKKKVSLKRKTSLKSEKSKASRRSSKRKLYEETLSYSVESPSHSPTPKKFDLGVALKGEEMPQVRLPQRYFDDKIVVLTRDPWWLHTYWDISKEREEGVLSKIPPQERGFLKKVLRVYDVSGTDIDKIELCNFFDVEINSEAFNWYINVNRPGSSFCIEIGYLTLRGKFFPLARSNIVKTPYFGISEQLDEEWILPEEEYYKILGVYDLGKSSLERRKALRMALEKGVSSLGASGLFSPLLRKKIKRRFSFEVYTELIIYGRTHPKATLTLKGEKVELREDGTFRLRFHLPQGKFEFPFEAISASGEDRIKITPIVERTQK